MDSEALCTAGLMGWRSSLVSRSYLGGLRLGHYSIEQAHRSERSMDLGFGVWVNDLGSGQMNQL